MENKNKKYINVIKRILKICLTIIFTAIVLMFIFVIFVIYRCSSEGNGFSIDKDGIINAISSPFKNVMINEFEPDWDSYKILIRDGCDPLKSIDINNINDNYYVVYQGMSLKDSTILNSDFHLKPNKKYMILNKSVLNGHSMVDYIFTTDSLCRIDSIFKNTILIYPK